MSTSSLSNKLKKDIVWTISSIICKSFGPESQKTLLCTSTGKVIVTSDGMTILGALHLSHPIAKLVVKSLQKQQCFTRDGAKTFLVYLSHALMALDKLAVESSVSQRSILGSSCDPFWNRISMQFMRIERDVLPLVYNELYTKSVVKTNVEDVLNDLKSVLNTTMSPQLTRNNTELFKNLVIEILTETCSILSSQITLASLKQKAEFMCENFDFLHLKLSKHLVDSSYAIPGLLLRQDFSLKLPSLEESHKRFVMLLCSIEGNTCENPEEIVFLKDQASVRKAFSFRVTGARMFVNVLKESSVSLILCSEKVPDYVLSLCREYGLSVVSCVDEEDVRFLERITGTQAITSPYDAVDGRHIGELSTFDRKLIGMKRFVHLEFLEEVSSRIPGMMVIGAPTDGMVDQLTSVVYKAVKSIQMCFAFQNTFGSNASGTNDCSKDSDAEVYDTSSTPKFTAIGGGGFFEIQTAYLLRKLSSNFSDLETGPGCKVLHDCLLSVPMSLHRNLSRNSTTETRDYMHKLQAMLEGVDQCEIVGLDRRGRVCNPVESGVLEPLASKISVLASVVQLLQQLIRIDSVVSVRTLDVPQ